jgi:hypothetical protein
MVLLHLAAVAAAVVLEWQVSQVTTAQAETVEMV